MLKNVLTRLGYFDVAKSENVIGVSELIQVSEIFHICVQKSIRNTQLLILVKSLCYKFYEVLSIFSTFSWVGTTVVVVTCSFQGKRYMGQ